MARQSIPITWEGGSGEARVHESSPSLSVDLAETIITAAQASISARGVFTIAISGGSVVNCLGLLASPELAPRCDWSSWHFFWVDERCVPLTHADSNYRAAQHQLLGKVPIPASNLHHIDNSLLRAAADPAAAAATTAEAYALELRRCVEVGILASTPAPATKSMTASASNATSSPATSGSATSATTFPRFDLIILGVGPDGHVASLFPHHPLLSSQSLWCAPIHDSPKPPPCRITFTLPLLLSARNVTVVAMGGGKRDVMSALFRGEQHKSRTEEGKGEGFKGRRLKFSGSGLPASLVLPWQGSLLWLMDKDAAEGLVEL